MLKFKTITLEDKKTIDECLLHKISLSCDYCFANLYAWQVRFKTEFAIEQDTLFLKYEDKGEVFFMFPTGKMALKKSLEHLIEYAKLNNLRIKMKAVSAEMWKQIDEQMPGAFSFTPERENYEYIYLTERLTNLSGKKLQSKRNHINRFKAENPNWEFRQIATREDCYQCWNMLKQWEIENNADDDISLVYEFQACKLMLRNFFELQLKGGMIIVNGQIVAFSIGEALNDDTFVVHVEKAPREMNGGYTIINQQMAEYLAADYKYINREEDMGIESLRKAKLSYQPEIILQEGIVQTVG